MLAVIERTSGSRSFWLLLSLFALILAIPIAEKTGIGEGSIKVAFALVILSGIYRAGRRRGGFLIAVTIALLWLALAWLTHASEAIHIKIADGVLFVLFGSYTMLVVLEHVVSAEDVDFDILCGGVSLYLLLGVTWAVVYQLLESTAPGSFRLSAGGTLDLTSELLYFSFTTLTTLGYGDITPVDPVARILSVMESVAGALFLAVFVARLVSLYRK